MTRSRTCSTRAGAQLGDALPRGGIDVIAEMAPDGRQVATVELLPETSPAPVGSPPGSPGLSGFVPYLFVMAPTAPGARPRRARSSTRVARRTARADRQRGAAPFAVGLCLLAVNTSHECERDVARDLGHDLFNPAFSPDGRFAAVVQAPDTEIGLGPIVVYDTATGAPVRTLTSGQDAQPSWSPDGRFDRLRPRQRHLRRATAAAGTARRVLTGGQQPVWVTAPACRVRRHPPVRVRGRSAIVTACAPQPGRVTVTLRSGSRRVARRSVHAATGGIVTVRFRRPGGRGCAPTFASRR